MVERLPPLNTLRVFDAVVRHMSFTRAAAELGMTQAAVSYQIKLLEDRIGAPVSTVQPPARVKRTFSPFFSLVTEGAKDIQLLKAASRVAHIAPSRCCRG